jgi:hypothetical protein
VDSVDFSLVTGSYDSEVKFWTLDIVEKSCFFAGGYFIFFMHN